MPNVADTLHDALRHHGWSISEAAAQCNVDRAFLSRLLQGNPPPRRRSGHRPATEDVRYGRLQKVLGLPASFLDQVVAEQGPAADLDQEDLISLFETVVLECRPLIPIKETGAVVRFVRQFVDVARQPQNVARVADRIFELDEVPLPASVLRATTPGSERLTYSFSGLRPDGSFNEAALAQRAEMLNAFGHAVIRAGGNLPLDLRIDIADLFFRLASRNFQAWDEAVRLTDPTTWSREPGAEHAG